ncbi:MAG: 3-oxoacyl-ACP synthase [Alphaproteobacteria bacterium BRH_c36]|nr:MAG: 3-oxoacyl-ACP synthase [Alphaproteobacteria bacterium BRH_c36]
MAEEPKEVWITGIGLATSLGDGVREHWEAMADVAAGPALEIERFEPYCVHRLIDINFSKQIPKKSDLRQMERWQRIGVYSAGLALNDAGIAGEPSLLALTHLVVAAGSGERDTAVDSQVLDALATRADTAVLAKEILPSALRPTLFLAQLSNLLAGNISIVHNVTASSRTFMGEEMAGISAVENAVRRVAAGQAELVLVGGALNAEREDLLLGYELGCNLWANSYRPVWQRLEAGSGFIPGSAGAFLVVEAREHAEARGAKSYARLKCVVSDRARRSKPGQIRESLDGMFDKVYRGHSPGPIAVLSGASGVAQASAEELAFLDGLDERHFTPVIRAYGSRLGHTVEAHFPLGIALAALALDRGGFYPPYDEGGEVEAPFPQAGALDRVLVTGVGHWRGEGLAVMERTSDGRA